MEQTPVGANAVQEGKAGYRKITVTLPPGVYERLIRESARRKSAGEPNRLISALLREAVVQYLEQLGA